MKFFQIVKEKAWVIALVAIALLFFYKTVFFFEVPFPGDLLVGEYSPYSSYSFLGYVPGSFPNKAQNFDVIELLYPAKNFSIESLKNFEIPLWNPYNFSGTPHLASLQSGTFYPLNLIFLFLPFIFAWTIFIISQPILAGIFTFLLLRQLHLDSKSSLFGSVVFAFSSYFVVWMEYGSIGHSIMWLPFLMYLFLKFIKKPSIVLGIGIIFGLTFSLLAGYIQTSFYVFLFLFAFVLFNIFFVQKVGKVVLLSLIPIFLLPVLLSSIQLLPMIELFNHSTRTSYSSLDFFKLLIPKVHLATLFAPDFFGNPATRNYWIAGTYIERVSYIGIIPLILLIFTVVKNKSKIVWFFALSFLVVIFLSFDNVIARSIYSVNIPILSTAVPTRLMFVFSFSASVLAAFGFSELQKINSKDKKLIMSLILVGSACALLWLVVFFAPKLFPDQSWISNLSISKRNLILPTGLLLLSFILFILFIFQDKFRKYILFALFLLSAFDLFYFFQKITPFSPAQSVYPKTEVLTAVKNIQGIDRSWGYGSGYIESNIHTFEKMYGTDGYDALHIKRYQELVSSSVNGKIPEKIARSEAEIIRGFGSDDLRNNNHRQRILNLLGVKYLIHKVNSGESMNPDYQTFNESIYQLVWNKDNWQIYENKDSLPRISLFDNYIIENDQNKIIKKIHDPAFKLKDTLILEERLPGKYRIEEDEAANVKIQKYSPNEMVLITESSEDSLLFVSDSYFPGWKVTIDGEEGKIYRADFAFRAVPISKGNHEVVFSYSPNSFNLGLKISALTFILILLMAFLIRIKSYART